MHSCSGGAAAQCMASASDFSFFQPCRCNTSSGDYKLEHPEVAREGVEETRYVRMLIRMSVVKSFSSTCSTVHVFQGMHMKADNGKATPSKCSLTFLIDTQV